MRVLKWIVIILAILLLGGWITYLIIDKPLPDGEKGPKAEALADKMLAAVNDSAWQQTAVVAWSYAGQHDFVWDKKRHFTRVSWENYEVFLNISEKTGIVKVKGKTIKDEEAKKHYIQQAYEFWANDSFWMNPIVKIRDGGTERRYVELDNPDQEGLLVTYNSGGVTPGDSYLWKINKESGLPDAWQFWVQIIPIGGLEFTWENWVKTETGAIIATEHKGPISVSISNLKTYPSIQDYEEGDIFGDL